MRLFLRIVLLFCHEKLQEFEGCYIGHCFLKLDALLHKVVLYKQDVCKLRVVMNFVEDNG